jgi:hypothetical protein
VAGPEQLGHLVTSQRVRRRERQQLHQALRLAKRPDGVIDALTVEADAEATEHPH